jgi:methylglyoxal synthase
MEGQRCIALIAHDEKKDDMADFARHHQKALANFKIVATGTTGGRVQEACPGLEASKAALSAATSRSAR